MRSTASSAAANSSAWAMRAVLVAKRSSGASSGSRRPRRAARTCGRCRPRWRAGGRRSRRSRRGRCSGGGCRAAGRATPAATHAEPWLSRQVSAESISETSTWRPAPVARALDQRRLDAVGREQAADEVDDRGAGLQRPPVRLAGDRHQPAHGLQQEVVARQRGRRLRRRPERGHRAGDEARVARRAQRVAVEAPARRSAPAGRTRSARRPARPAPARARDRLVERGPARSSACCGSGRGSRSLSPSCQGGPQARVSSPPSGRSTLITSAPRSPSSIAASGPASTREKSATRIPSKRRHGRAH